ncbi:Uncharacterised protein [Clostridioides difficile]|nr:Uncharacterised protein [Clostridioides difficile]
MFSARPPDAADPGDHASSVGLAGSFPPVRRDGSRIGHHVGAAQGLVRAAFHEQRHEVADLGPLEVLVRRLDRGSDVVGRPVRVEADEPVLDFTDLAKFVIRIHAHNLERAQHFGPFAPMDSPTVHPAAIGAQPRVTACARPASRCLASPMDIDGDGQRLTVREPTMTPMVQSRRQVDPVAQAQARVLVDELERVADSLVDSLQIGRGGEKALRTARRELYEVREHVRRLQATYELFG